MDKAIDKDKLLIVEHARNGLDFNAYLYSLEGVMHVAYFSYRDGWTTADMEEMLTEAIEIVKKNKKKWKFNPKNEEPS